MDIYYAGKDNVKIELLKKKHKTIIILLFDRWDDFDYKTTFPTYCQVNWEEVELSAIKILFENQQTSYAYLDELVLKGWDGKFPVREISYISNVEDIIFYEQIDGHLGINAAIEVAKTMCDASYMAHIIEDPKSRELIDTRGFEKSLQRERGGVKSFLDVWRFLSSNEISIGDLSFRFRTSLGDIQLLKMNFSPVSPLPHDINVLIGPNGIGKSQVLIQIVHDWLRSLPSEQSAIGFETKPNFKQVVVVSYSPFELFPIDSKTVDDQYGNKRQDENVYRYFGLRAQEVIYKNNGEEVTRTRLSRKRPHLDSVESLLTCLDDDRVHIKIKSWSKKVSTLYSVLKTAIDFDDIAIGVSSYDKINDLYMHDSWLIDNDYVEVEKGVDEVEKPQAYISIKPVRIDEPDTIKLRKYLHTQSGIVFLKNNQVLQLSSGQRLFSYMVTNILGSIRRNSLVLIDEPELFLHPTLEIAFLKMLKEILENFSSKALIATHSLVTVRELPKRCVHVFEKNDSGLFINHPPFETFGGDIQRISSYVFGDKSVSKPFESWLEVKLKEYGSAEELIKALGENINEEMLIQINSMEEKCL